ncbi:RCC1 domain-containing protein [Polyangium mundeleinium]|uniref:RCC1 domain-containing protein n=1 Tax=Polyangium mundeleinium TaxID=2995306 RepID=A0ABT5EEX1_9BACT|nr:RCC1 domain-containing protein [Polyangium mundeleinium]MDC0739803.1 RCC1 domain-containing protein [Polyangium mundeleinium]
MPSREEVRGVVGATAIGVGGRLGCAALANGTVQCWGAGKPGLGAGLEAEPVPFLDGVASVAVGAGHGCARLTSGEVRCWGHNASGAARQRVDDFAGRTGARSESPTRGAHCGGPHSYVRGDAGRARSGALL